MLGAPLGKNAPALPEMMSVIPVNDFVYGLSATPNVVASCALAVFAAGNPASSAVFAAVALVFCASEYKSVEW